jgi:reactive intermediate/imine deaminase
MNDQLSGGTIAGGLPFSEALSAGALLFISGQIGVGGGAGQGDVNLSFEEEVHSTMKNLGAVLQRQGSGFGELVQVTIYLTDISNYAETNRVYAGFFSDRYPSRVCIAVRELPMKARIEISAIARLPLN